MEDLTNPFYNSPRLKKAIADVSFEDLLDELQPRIKKDPLYAAEFAGAILRHCTNSFNKLADESEKERDMVACNAYTKAVRYCTRSRTDLKHLFACIDRLWDMDD